MKTESESEDIAYRLRYWRDKVLQLKQEQFAEATGLHLGVIRKYENRKSIPGGMSLLAIAKTGVNLHWLLTGQGEMRSEAKETELGIHYPGGVPVSKQRLSAIEGLLEGIDEDKRAAVLEEIFSRVQEAKRVSDLEEVVKEMVRKIG